MPTKFTIREVKEKEAAEISNWLGSYAFMPSPPIGKLEDAIERVERRKGDVHYAAFEDDKAVSHFLSIPMTQNVRGKIYPTSGIAGVSSHPSVRRKGYVRKLAEAVLKANYEAGMVFSTLYPFKESFYESLGYVTFPAPLEPKLKIEALLPLVKQGYGETVELSTIKESQKIYLDFLRSRQTKIHGLGLYDHYPLPKPDDPDAWVAVYKNEGAIEGILLYKLEGEALQMDFKGYRFYTNTTTARYHLLGWIGRHVDQATTVTLRIPGTERPSTWLSNLILGMDRHWIPPMGRIVNIEKMAGMTVGDGKFSARLTDPHCPWNEGVWQFESNNSKLHINPTEQAGCTLNTQGLAALVYGTNDPADFSPRGWGAPSTENQAQMRSLFPPAYPHLHEIF